MNASPGNSSSKITDMGYHIWSFVIGQLQSDVSIWNPKRLNELIYTEFFTFSQKRFIIFTQAVIYIHCGWDINWRSTHTLQVFLNLPHSVCVFLFGKFNNDPFFSLYLVTNGNPQYWKSLLRHPAFWTTGGFFQFLIFDWIREAT